MIRLPQLLLGLLLVALSALPARALVSEGRAGVAYTNHIFFLQQKTVEDGRVVAASLAFGDPRSNTELCRNSFDVFGGLELFRGIPERSWVLVDFTLQSILIADGFVGDADVTRVTPCDDHDACTRLAQLHAAQQPQSATAAPKTSRRKANFEDFVRDLNTGRSLIKAARCRGCHRLEGFGADHAPSLEWKRAKYVAGWLQSYLERPYRMRPGMSDLMMLAYTSPNAQPNLQQVELEAVAGYLVRVATGSAPDERYRREQWQGYDCSACHSRLYRQQPLHFEPTPVPTPLRELAAKVESFKTCLTCHPFGDVKTTGPLEIGHPNAFATDLLLAFEKLRSDYLAAFLSRPSYLAPATRMPDLDLTPAQVAELVALAEEIKQAIADGRLTPRHTPYLLPPAERK